LVGGFALNQDDSKMKLQSEARASVERELVGGFALNQDDSKMKLQSEARASVERELVGGFALNQDDSKMKLQSEARASVERELVGGFALNQDDSKMNIAIMGAMPEEIEPLLEYYGEYETIEYAKNIFYLANYKGHNIVIAYSKIGKVYATITALTMIEKFKCKKLLFSGVAGAISSDLGIGDLTVATKLSQHDLDISAFGHPYGYVPEGSVYEEADKELIEFAKEIALQKGINLKESIIATGDQFICDVDRKKWIEKTFLASAVEMEGAAVALTCNVLDIPFFILRSISDAADMDASFDFDEFLKSSSKRSADFIISMVDKIIDNA